MNPNDADPVLNYVSSSPDLIGIAPIDEVKAQDEEDLPTLNRMFKLLKNQQSIYNSTSYLTLGSITVENQLIIAQQMLLRLQELESLLVGTLTKIQEKRLNERR